LPDPTTLEGRAALEYLRRHPGTAETPAALLGRQQEFLRGFLDRLGDVAPRDPVTGTRLAGQLPRLVAVDAGLDNDEIRDLAWELRHLQGESVQFFAAPTRRDGVRLDPERARSMFAALRSETLGAWGAANESRPAP
jgi:hypothetical protein